MQIRVNNKRLECGCVIGVNAYTGRLVGWSIECDVARELFRQLIRHPDRNTREGCEPQWKLREHVSFGQDGMPLEDAT